MKAISPGILLNLLGCALNPLRVFFIVMNFIPIYLWKSIREGSALNEVPLHFYYAALSSNFKLKCDCFIASITSADTALIRTYRGIDRLRIWAWSYHVEVRKPANILAWWWWSWDDKAFKESRRCKQYAERTSRKLPIEIWLIKLKYNQLHLHLVNNPDSSWISFKRDREIEIKI